MIPRLKIIGFQIGRMEIYTYPNDAAEMRLNEDGSIDARPWVEGRVWGKPEDEFVQWALPGEITDIEFEGDAGGGCFWWSEAERAVNMWGGPREESDDQASV